MNILSLFDGLSGAKLALNNIGIECQYFASEIDKYAEQVSRYHYPDIIRLGDVKNIKGKDLPRIDLLIGGSPCQGFSPAGKHLNFKDPRSALFFEYVRLLKECNPKYFVLENVKMKKDYVDVISNYLRVPPIMINSALVTAQNRKRLYWANFPVVQPKDRKIYLKDIIEEGLVDRDKSYCIDANYYKGTNLNTYFNKNKRQLVFGCKKLGNMGSDSQGQRVYSIDGKSCTIISEGGGLGARTGLYAIAQIRKKSKSIRCGSRGSEDSHEWDNVFENIHIRKLTPKECERLQGVPNNFTALGINESGNEVKISNTQRYKMLGNGFTIPVIEHILKEIF